MGLRSWHKKLSKRTYIGVGVPPESGMHGEVSVVAHWHGVTLAFEREDKSDHLCIYLEPEDARAIGKELMEKADVYYGIHVLDRLKGDKCE